MPLITKPEQKGTGEKILEWVPVTGTVITGKDAYMYFSDGKYMAGSIMTVATLVSLAGDISLLTGFGAPGKAGAVAAEKALDAAAKKAVAKAAQFTATKAADVTTRFAEKRVMQQIVDTGGNVTKDAIEAQAKKSVEYVANRPNAGKLFESEWAGEGAERTMERTTDKIAGQVAETGVKVSARVREILETPSVRKQMAAMNEQEKKIFVRNVTAEAWQQVTGKGAPLAPVADKTLKETLGEVPKAMKGKVRTAAKKAREFANAESLVMRKYMETKALAESKENLWQKMILWGGHSMAVVPYGIADAGRGMLKGGLVAGEKSIERIATRPVPALSGVTARKGIGWVGVKVGEKTKASEPKKDEKKQPEQAKAQPPPAQVQQAAPVAYTTAKKIDALINAIRGVDPNYAEATARSINRNSDGDYNDLVYQVNKMSDSQKQSIVKALKDARMEDVASRISAPQGR